MYHSSGNGGRHRSRERGGRRSPLPHKYAYSDAYHSRVSGGSRAASRGSFDYENYQSSRTRPAPRSRERFTVRNRVPVQRRYRSRSWRRDRDIIHSRRRDFSGAWSHRRSRSRDRHGRQFSPPQYRDSGRPYHGDPSRDRKNIMSSNVGKGSNSHRIRRSPRERCGTRSHSAHRDYEYHPHNGRKRKHSYRKYSTSFSEASSRSSTEREKSEGSGVGHGDSYDDSKDDSVGHYNGKAGDVIAERYEVIQEVGLGTFGRVLECLDRNERRHVAIKVVRNVKKYTESAQIEADILRDVNRCQGRGITHCVQMFGHFDFEGHCCLVFEKLGASLYEFLKAQDFVPYLFTHVKAFARQLLETLEFLHERLKLIHTDLKPENILLCSNDTSKTEDGQVVPQSTQVKVIDFGGATYDDDDHKSTIVNTRQYRAPEVILEVGWSYSSDLWSAGCIITELYTGDLLFATHNNMEHLALMERCLGRFPKGLLNKSKVASKFFNISQAQSRWREELDKESQKHVRRMNSLSEIFYEHSSSGIVELIEGLLVIDPNKRLTAREALDMPFFRQTS